MFKLRLVFEGNWPIKAILEARLAESVVFFEQIRVVISLQGSDWKLILVGYRVTVQKHLIETVQKWFIWGRKWFDLAKAPAEELNGANLLHSGDPPEVNKKIFQRYRLTSPRRKVVQKVSVRGNFSWSWYRYKIENFRRSGDVSIIHSKNLELAGSFQV